MTSERKRESNRQNSRKSTGPKTERGKQFARFNALKRGMYANSQTIPGEVSALYLSNYVDVLNTYQPEGFIEEELCKQIANATWRLGRLEKAEVVALKRTEVSIVSNDLRFSGDRTSPNDDEIEYTLMRYLERELSENPAAYHPPAPPSEEQLDKSGGGPVATEWRHAPVAFTILKGYTSGSSNPPCREIEALIRTGTIHLLRLHAALEAIQERRRSVTGSVNSA